MATSLGKLVRDMVPALGKQATLVQKADHAGRLEFLLTRGRAWLEANKTWQGSAKGDVSDVGVAPLRTALTSDLTAAAGSVLAITQAMADPTRTDLLAIDNASIDPAGPFRRTYMSILSMTPAQVRATAVVSAAWGTLATQGPTMSTFDLHQLVARRLMVAERMLWYIGRIEGRNWSFAAGGGFKAGKVWQDGWRRLFEYPRLEKRKAFDQVCKATAANPACAVDGPMKGWTRRVVGKFSTVDRLNPTAATKWKVGPKIKDNPEEQFFFVKSGQPNPAIADLFVPSARFDERSLLFCDQVIQCLHLEALARAKAKRDGDPKWLKPLTDAEPEGWLRVIYPGYTGDKFLVGGKEPRFFEYVGMAAQDLVVGDHTIVINHPAYEKAMDSSSVWRLENAIVVTTFPRLMLQGHGTNPLPFTSNRKVPVKEKVDGKEVTKLKAEPAMRLNMLGLFNAKLHQFREAAKAENKKASPRPILDTFDSSAVLVQRTTSGPYSGYDPNGFTPQMLPQARWWMRWKPDAEKEEPKIAADPAWARQTWDKHRVELQADFAYFPLWLPQTDKAGNPIRKGGKISSLQSVFVTQRMAAGWSWYYEKDASPDDAADLVASVRRPKAS